MNMQPIDRWGGMEGWALCAAYDVLQICVLPVNVRHAGATQFRTICWALGAHGGTGTEVVGRWIAKRIDDFDWRTVTDGLANRGVMRVGCLVAPEIERVESALRQLIVVDAPSAVWQGQVPAKAASAQLRRQTIRTAATVRQFARALHLAVARYGTFDCDAAALDFVGEALGRLERRACWIVPGASRAGKPRSRRRRPAVTAA